MSTSSESSLSAYRTVPAAGAEPGESDHEAFRERLHPVFVFVWAASFARVAGAFYCREVLGAEATLALMTLVGLTWYAIAVRTNARRDLGSR
jgi:hypothetical protein